MYEADHSRTFTVPEDQRERLSFAAPWRVQPVTLPAGPRVLAVVPGGAEREAAYHEQFKAHRLHGEWFAPHPDILAEIDRFNMEPTHDL